MSTETKQKTNIWAAFKSFFETSKSEYENIEFTDEQREAQAKADSTIAKASGTITENVGKTTKKGGFAKIDTPIKNPKIEKAMRIKHDAEVEKRNSEKEIVD